MYGFPLGLPRLRGTLWNYGKAARTAGFEFEGDPSFPYPVFVGITFIRGLAVRAYSEAQRLRCRPKLSIRHHVFLLYHCAQTKQSQQPLVES